MKKILALVLAVLMVATMCVAFASCGKNSDWKNIEEKGKFVCGITIYAPMNYYDANGDLEEDESGTLIGFDTELAKLVAQKLGVEVEFIEIDWSNKILELDSGSIDVVWNGMTLTNEVMNAMECTIPYCNNAQVVVLP